MPYFDRPDAARARIAELEFELAESERALAASKAACEQLRAERAETRQVATASARGADEGVESRPESAPTTSSTPALSKWKLLLLPLALFAFPALVSIAAIFFFQYCGDRSSPSTIIDPVDPADAGRSDESKAATEQRRANLAELRRQMCACRDQTCADSLRYVLAAWRRMAYAIDAPNELEKKLLAEEMRQYEACLASISHASAR